MVLTDPPLLGKASWPVPSSWLFSFLTPYRPVNIESYGNGKGYWFFVSFSADLLSASEVILPGCPHGSHYGKIKSAQNQYPLPYILYLVNFYQTLLFLTPYRSVNIESYSSRRGNRFSLSLTHQLINSFTHSLIHSLTHPPTNCLLLTVNKVWCLFFFGTLPLKFFWTLLDGYELCHLIGYN